jgi:arylformamidase
MIAEIAHKGRTFRVDLSKPLDLSMPLHAGPDQARAWWVDPVTHGSRYAMARPIYAVKEGSPVNFRTIRFNPHGHGTHTESVGHIAPEVHPCGGAAEALLLHRPSG